MPVVIPPLARTGRGPAWKWSVCVLLLLATMVNYMDRQTLVQMADLILKELRLDEGHYGRMEAAFAYAFAFGALLMGWLADSVNVRWLYPAAVLVWSAAGFATGLADGFAGLVACRFALGLAESANWPCALRTTQRILPPEERTLGNGILQSGASVGACLTPLVVFVLLSATGSWRSPFFAIGTLGAVWAVLWLLLLRVEDLALPPRGRRGGWGWPDARAVRRFLALVVVVVMINASWHFFRAWLPLFLVRQHGYSMAAAGWFVVAYYIATDLGALSAGFAVLYLTRRGLSVHRSRLAVFLACALLTSLSVVAARLPAGPALLGLLLVIGFGALGVFPNYYSFSQELTVRHQGKVTGVLGCCCWLAMGPLHTVVGDRVSRTGSYSDMVALAGLAPLVGFAALLLLWGRTPAPAAPPGPGSAADGRVQAAAPGAYAPAGPAPAERGIRKG
jgi:ACS family hexuronate transporter-like MFS transporter